MERDCKAPRPRRLRWICGILQARPGCPSRHHRRKGQRHQRMGPRSLARQQRQLALVHHTHTHPHRPFGKCLLPQCDSRRPAGFRLMGCVSPIILHVCTLTVHLLTCERLDAPRSAKIWDLNDPSGDFLYNLGGSELSIWDVLILPGSTREHVYTLTASADKLIRLYENDKLVRTFKGHTQPVRGLSLLSGHQDLFASAGNDGSIRIWNYKSGEDIKALDGHDSFVYSLACTPEGDLVSSGEDRSVRIWDKASGELKQVITLPAISGQ